MGRINENVNKAGRYRNERETRTDGLSCKKNLILIPK